MVIKIYNILTKYENEIIEYTLGSNVNENNEKYLNMYKYEWKNAKHDISKTVSRLIKSKVNVCAESIATYIIISAWSDVVNFNRDNLNISKLVELCINIKNEILED